VLAPSIDHATALVAQQKAQQSQQLAARQAAVVAALSVPAVPPTFTNYAVTSAAGSGMPGVPIPATAAPSAADQSAALEVSASNMTPAQRAAIVAATAPGISTQTKVLIGAIGAAALVGGALYLANRK
jgi:hypothetical protein